MKKKWIAPLFSVFWLHAAGAAAEAPRTACQIERLNGIDSQKIMNWEVSIEKEGKRKKAGDAFVAIEQQTGKRCELELKSWGEGLFSAQRAEPLIIVEERDTMHTTLEWVHPTDCKIIKTLSEFGSAQITNSSITFAGGQDGPNKVPGMKFSMEADCLPMRNPNASAALGDNANARVLRIHGIDYPSSCDGVELAGLKKSVHGIAGPKRDPDQAWDLVETLLCREANPSNVEFLRRHLPRRIMTSSHDTGDPEAVDRKEPASRELALKAMSQGAAWGASVAQSGHDIEIMNRPNEACVNSSTLRFGGKTWLLLSSRNACD
jgi:hypothetical protein